MITLKESLQQLAFKRAQKVLEVISVGQELHDEGKIDAETLSQVTAEAEQGFPYQAQEVLERALSKHLLEQEALHDNLFLVTNQDEPHTPLRHIMNGSSGPTLKPAA